MKTLTKIILAVSFLFSVFCSLYSTANAAVPHLINYQGRLTDSSGNPLNGSYNLTFRIYDAQAAGNLLWEEVHSGVVIQKGIFSILLGSVTNLDLPFDKPYFLEIKVANEVMSPRQRIASVGYAIRAEKAEDALTAQQAQNAIRAEKAGTADGIKGSENTFLGSGNVGIGTADPSAKLDVQGGVIKFKGIRMDHVTGSNPQCTVSTGAIVIRKWDSETIPEGSNNSSCTTTAGWSVNPPTCTYSQLTQTGTWDGQPQYEWVNAIFTSSRWSEVICMGN